jgi:hypothetical protein
MKYLRQITPNWVSKLGSFAIAESPVGFEPTNKRVADFERSYAHRINTKNCGSPAWTRFELWSSAGGVEPGVFFQSDPYRIPRDSA